MSTNIHSNKARVIFHIDMNCFYAAVEMAYKPELKGKPVAIAGNPEERRGIIVTSSYEARDKGVKTTMALWEARKLCPNLIVKKPNFERYRKASKQIFKILAKVTPLIEPISIDEGYMDITNHQTDNPIKMAEDLQKHIKKTLDLPCSIGIGPNKFLAKMASDMKKPMGITVLRKRDLPQKLWPLRVEEMFGIGKKTAQKLRKINVKTIKDLANSDVYQLTNLLGINGERLKNYANGHDIRPVDPDAINEFKSIGSSQTLRRDTTNANEINSLVDELSRNVAQRMQRQEVAGITVQITIRYSDLKTITRSKKMETYIDDQQTIVQVATELFYQHWNLEPIRLFGVTVQNIEEKQNIAKQLNLFTYKSEIEDHKLHNVIDSLSEKYGENPFKQLKTTVKNEQQQFKTSFQKDFLNDYQND